MGTWIGTGTLLVAGALTLMACSDSGQTVELSMAPRVEEQTIVVGGTTDLPDGAQIAYEVTHDAFGTSDDLQDATWSLFADGTVPVEGGRYSVDVPVAGWPSGDATVWVAFQVMTGDIEGRSGGEGQPPTVVERYGEMGANLTGSNVSESAGLKRVELEQTVTLP